MDEIDRTPVRILYLRKIQFGSPLSWILEVLQFDSGSAQQAPAAAGGGLCDFGADIPDRYEVGEPADDGMRGSQGRFLRLP